MTRRYTPEEARRIVEEQPERFKRIMADPEARLELTRALAAAKSAKGRRGRRR